VRYYLDGSAFERALGQFPETGVLRDWIIANRPDLATSILARWEVAEQMALLDHGLRVQAGDLLGMVREVPISGRALEVGSFAVAALPPYAALHVGIAASTDGISVMVTYDAEVAGAARLHGLDVFSPGRQGNWYVE
jgi:hypothetical protein